MFCVADCVVVGSLTQRSYEKILIFARIHWVKQIHTRTVVRDGVVQERKTTERVLIRQDGDEPPEELQRSINQLAEDFMNYELHQPPAQVQLDNKDDS